MNEEGNREHGGIMRKLWIPIGLVVVFFQGIRTISHADFWTHLATGRWIAANGIPREDPLTLVSQGEPWIHGSWLYDVILYHLWNIGGSGLVTLIHVLVVVLAFYLLVRVVRSEISAPAIGATLLIIAWLLAPVFEVRPAILCLLFPALFILVLSHSRDSLRPFAVLIPSQILWANLDPSFIWGPVIGLMFSAQAHFQSPDADSRRRGTKRLGGLTAGLLVASMITPYGPAIYGASLATWISPIVRDWISPISGQFDYTLPRHMVTLALAIGAAGLLTRRDRLPLGLTGTAVIGAFLVVQSMPVHMALFAVFAFPFLALSVHAFDEFVAHRLSRILDDHQATVRNMGTGVFLLVAVLSFAGMATNRAYVQAGSFSSFGFGTVTQLYPEAAQSVMERPDFPERFLNLPLDGGYLVWSHPERRAFIDQRGAVHGQAAYSALAKGLLGQEDAWNALLTKWEPEAVILNNTWAHAVDMMRHLLAQNEWHIVYFDGTTTILVLGTSDRIELLLEKDKLLGDALAGLDTQRRIYSESLGGLVLPPIPPALYGAAAVFQGRGYYEQAAACHELLTYGAPRLVMAKLNLGICQTMLEKHDRAVRTLTSAIDRLRRGSQPWLRGHMNMGIARIGQGEYSQAVRHLHIVTDHHPENPLTWLWLSRAYHGLGQATDAQRAIERARSLDPELTAAFQRAR